MPLRGRRGVLLGTLAAVALLVVVLVLQTRDDATSGFLPTPAARPGAPGTPTVAPGNPVRLHWAAATSATAYIVTALPDQPIDGRRIAMTQQLSATRATFTGLLGGRRWTFSVTALDARGRSAPTTTTARIPFVHPGILLDRSQLDLVRGHLAGKDEPWDAALASLRDDRASTGSAPFSSASYQPQAVEQLECRADAAGCARSENDALAAYANALLGYYSGNPGRELHRNAAVAILNHFAATLASVDAGSNNAHLFAAWLCQILTRAAEIVRATPFATRGSALDDAALRTMFYEVLRPQLVLDRAHYAAGALTPDHYFHSSAGNWELARADALVDLGVLFDDGASFDAGVALWRARVPAYIYLARDGPEPASPPLYTSSEALQCLWNGQPVKGQPSPAWTTCRILPDPSAASGRPPYNPGQSQEMCRDLDHAQLGLENLTFTATTAGIQGVDLYGEQDARIRAAWEFYSTNADAWLRGDRIPTSVCGVDPADPVTRGHLNACTLELIIAAPDACNAASGSAGTGHRLGGEAALAHYGPDVLPATARFVADCVRTNPNQHGHALSWETLTLATRALAAPPADTGFCRHGV